MPGTAGKTTGMVWKDAMGRVIPVVGESVQVDPQGPSILYFADPGSPALAWALTPANGAIAPASRIAPVFPSDDCTGTPYVHAVSRWTYDVIGAKKIVWFKDDAKPVRIMEQSTFDALGKCIVSSSAPDNYFSIDDATAIAPSDVPANRFTIPIHAEYVQ